MPQPPGNGSETAADGSAAGFETDLPDLTGVTLQELSAIGGDELELAVGRVLCQVEKPRTNLGSSGPPGRTD